MSASPSDPGRAARRAALADELTLCALALRDTLAGVHLDVALARRLGETGGPGSQPPVPPHCSSRAVRDMAYGAMRRLGRLRFLAARVNGRRPAPLLGALQLAAIAQLLDGKRPAAVVIDQAVAAARGLPEALGNRFSAGFINATLRRFVRERPALLSQADEDPEAMYNHPAWWIEAMKEAWPRVWEQILVDSQVHAPLTLRVNRRSFATAHTVPAQVPPLPGAGAAVAEARREHATGAAVAEATRELAARAALAEAARRLADARLPNRPVGPEALVLEQAVGVAQIPGFAAGCFTVQDAGAQLAAQLLAPANAERILDACAAPGGKTTHLLQSADCHVLALDVDARRAVRITENLQRERLPIHPRWPPPAWGAVVLTADAACPDSWWDGEPFDKILLDAPCSASGIVRRHPDVPWHRNRRDIATLAARQLQLLQALWPLLRPGGTLLYVTCSVFPEEGEAVVAAFGSHQAGCVREPVSTSWSDGQTILSQLLPTSTGAREHDGYFYALLSKKS